ncbi:hypothetical protein OAJ57_04695 [Alphaproteobacteria bacterium]|nr:hypothetical protein [Alphaproteobacteria bacterium]
MIMIVFKPPGNGITQISDTLYNRCAYAIYFILAVVCMVAWWRLQIPFPLLGSDSSNIASFAAAWEYPERFATDPTLGRIEVYGQYATIHIPLLIGLSKLFGDYGTATMMLLIPALFLQGIGFHLLGLTLFKDRLAASLLALLSFGTVSLTLDYYGTYIEPQPRLLFLALLPFALLLLFRTAERPKQWPGVFAVFGLLMYVHPVSAPTIALASWLAAWIIHPLGLPFWYRFKWMLAAGLTFLIAVSPFMFIYLSTRAYGGVDDYALLSELNHKIFGAEYNDYRSYISTMLTRWETRLLLPLWGSAGFLAVWILAPWARRRCLFFVAWGVAIVAGSAGITALEQWISRATQTMPVEIDLIRNLRYICLPLILFGVWGSRLATRRLHAGGFGIVAAIVICIAWLSLNRPGSIPFRATIACLAQGQFLCKPVQWEKDITALDVLRDLPPGTKFLPFIEPARVRFSLAIRYYALKPLVWTNKDGGSVLGYTKFDELKNWWAIRTRMANARTITDSVSRTGAVMNIAELLKADAVISDLRLVARGLATPWKLLSTAGGYAIALRCGGENDPCAE